MKKMNLWKKTLVALAAALAIVSTPISSAATQAAVSLRWPVPGHTTLSQPYHDGCAIDISDKSIAGANVVAALSGTVTHTFTCSANHYGSYGDCNGFGTGVVIKGTDGRIYQYAHMQAKSIPSNVYVGASVSAGQVIGKVGNTGYSGGTHLHFGISKGTYYSKSGINPANETYTDRVAQINVSYGTLSVGSITTKNAVISGSISNPSRANITTVGARIWDANGKQVKYYTEYCGRTLAKFNQALNINTEAKLNLASNSRYTVQFFAVAGGKTFYSGKVSFTTAKEANQINVSYGALSVSSITTKNAVIRGSISNPSRANITTVGARIWDASGRQVKYYTEYCGRTLAKFNQALNINTEAKLNLASNSRYTVQFFAIAGGKTFYSGKISFTTRK